MENIQFLNIEAVEKLKNRSNVTLTSVIK